MIFEVKNSIPKVIDMWTPHVLISKHHYVSFFLLRIKKLFEVRDKVIKVELTMEKMFAIILEVEHVLAKLGETPFKLLKEE